jgi:predicted RecB family nuclease
MEASSSDSPMSIEAKPRRMTDFSLFFLVDKSMFKAPPGQYCGWWSPGG